MSNPKLLILDDDPWVCRLVSEQLRKALPGLDVATRGFPDVSGEFGIYLIDDEFDGSSMSEALVRQIRDTRPDALILAFSAHLTRGTLMRLLNAGCDIAVEKGSPTAIHEIVEAVRDQMSAARTPVTRTGRFSHAMASLSDLVRQMNWRMRQISKESPRVS